MDRWILVVAVSVLFLGNSYNSCGRMQTMSKYGKFHALYRKNHHPTAKTTTKTNG